MRDDPVAAEFTLPERCGASTAHDLVAMGRSLAPGARLCVEAAAVVRMSCATIVALISLAQTATETGGAVIIRAPNNAFTDAFANLGLYESLMNMEFAE
jgi:anti-anti-sigma regulatory factor